MKFPIKIIFNQLHKERKASVGHEKLFRHLKEKQFVPDKRSLLQKIMQRYIANERAINI